MKKTYTYLFAFLFLLSANITNAKSIIKRAYYFDTNPEVCNGFLSLPEASTLNVACVGTGEFRSAGSGNWSALSTWQIYNGCAWVVATHIPSYTDSTITIQSGSNITVDVITTADQIVVNAGGTLIINGSTLTVADVAGDDLIINGTLTITGGALQGAGQVVVNAGGTFSWTTGNMGGSGTTTIQSGATANFSGASAGYLADTRVLNNNSANFLITGTGNIGITVGTTFNNNATGTITYTNNGGISYNGAGTINNFGTITKSGGTGTSIFGNSGLMYVNNYGIVNANIGTIRIAAISNHTGTFNVAAGATLLFDGGNQTFSSSSSISRCWYCNLFGR
jgi:hypothetical protein